MSAARFQDKVVLVTGSGRGFGAVLANAFAQEGEHVVVHYHSSARGAEETAAAIRALGRRALLVQGDIAIHADVKRMLLQMRSMTAAATPPLTRMAISGNLRVVTALR